MKDSYKLFITGLFLAVCFVFYWLCPKYHFDNTENGLYRFNRITGSVEIYTSKILRWVELKNYKNMNEFLKETKKISSFIPDNNK